MAGEHAGNHEAQLWFYGAGALENVESKRTSSREISGPLCCLRDAMVERREKEPVADNRESHSPLRANVFHDGELARRRGVHHLLFNRLVYLGAECLMPK